MQNERLTLDNICDGAVPDVFQRCLEHILHNIRDADTDAEAPRSLTVEFVFKPHSDRSGADITLRVREKLALSPTSKGAMYVQGRVGKLVAYPYDPRQAALFDAGETTTKQ